MRPALWSVAGELLTGPRRSVPVPGRVSVTQSESPAQAPMCPIHPFRQAGPLRPARWAGWGVPQHSARTRAPGHPEIPRESLRLKKKAPLLCSPLYFRFLLIVYFKRVLDRKQFADLGVIPPRVWGAPRLPGRTPVMPGTPARPRRASLLCPEVRLTQV